MSPTYPYKPGHTDADTSMAAAEAYLAHLAPMQRLCRATIREAGDGGLTGAMRFGSS